MIKTPLIFIPLLLCFSFVFLGETTLPAKAQNAVMGYAYPYDDGELEGQLGETPVVMELFSSQACMFCPMADQFVADLKKRTNLIVLACHVDYFDVREGAISTPECSQQQRDYARMIRGATLYTPQIVVNGAADYVGYEFDYLMDEVIEASKGAALQKLAVTAVDEAGANGQKRYELDLLPFADVSGLDIWLYMVEKDHNITIAEGANKGKKLPYVSIVRQKEKIGRWDGRAQKVGFSVAVRAEFDSFVVLLKNDRGVIFGAAQVKL
ncbi:MAG: DUF1223 domain-containing protein [Pseudomonadota bacterium]|jgi:hypothetical protein|nr:DUF1223 domain-containing protein [Pseudomonadota bacterium]MEC7703362.1 DUF1223 domain-containing protein [Pseudomonadota bacterium]MEC9236725.1 DUF1223 domain-containing protein [Pseudomonadota bacterium]MED5421893.1 DUF1223 domain-containing protein [Pseudomonadota bacterium]MEE3323330.1 DUF1223 domain-containing protein [Pseudomonadota bacterium]